MRSGLYVVLNALICSSNVFEFQTYGCAECLDFVPDERSRWQHTGFLNGGPDNILIPAAGGAKGSTDRVTAPARAMAPPKAGRTRTTTYVDRTNDDRLSELVTARSTNIQTGFRRL